MQSEYFNCKDITYRIVSVIVLNYPLNSPFISVYSFDDEGYGAVNDDINLLSVGICIVLIFVIVTLGRFNLVEHKVR